MSTSLLRPLIKGDGQGRVQSIVTAAGREVWAPPLDEVLHWKSSEMLACITITMMEPPQTLYTQIPPISLSYLSCWSHHCPQEMEEAVSSDRDLGSTAHSPRDGGFLLCSSKYPLQGHLPISYSFHKYMIIPYCVQDTVSGSSDKASPTQRSMLSWREGKQTMSSQPSK